MTSEHIYLIASSVAFGALALIWNRETPLNVTLKFSLAGLALWGVTVWI